MSKPLVLCNNRWWIVVPGLLVMIYSGMLGPRLEGQVVDDAMRKQIQEIVQNRIDSDHLAGVAVCVIINGKAEFCEAFGYAEMSTQRKLTTDTPFQLASLSKQFAATGVMLLVHDGKLSLDDPIGDYLDEIPEAWNAITVRHLLAHTSGIKDYAKFPNIRKDYQQDPDRGEMLERIYGKDLDFAPGTKFSYSNSGYSIVGCLIESVSGLSYATFLKQRIFEPLQMKTARLEPVQNQDPLRAIGHDFSGGNFRPATYNSPVWSFAAGGIVASINDLAKWDAAIDGNVLLSKAEQQELWETQSAGKQETGYGMGWMLTPAPEGKHFVFHYGNKPGFSATMARLVEDRFAIAVLSNRTEGSSQQLLDEIGKVLLGR